MLTRMASQWARHPVPRIAAIVLGVATGCFPRLPALQWHESPEGPTTILRTSNDLGCPASVVVFDPVAGQPLEPLSMPQDSISLVPPKPLQSSYDDYLARRGADRGSGADVTVEPGPVPPAVPIEYRLPIGRRRLRVGERSRVGVPIPVTHGGRSPELAGALLGISLLFAVADGLTRQSPVDVDVAVEAGKLYLLHCDAKRDPWAWVTPEPVSPSSGNPLSDSTHE